jgi:hypothetical protein
MELFLHIGTEKTGTTSIQHFMAHNRSLLQEQGVLYPRSPGKLNHIGITALAQECDHGELWAKLGIGTLEGRDQYASELEGSLEAELAAYPFTKVVLSNEHCSSRLMSDAEVDTLRKFLERFFSCIRVIIYLRRQDDFVVSTYSTGIKSGRTDPFELPKKRRSIRRYDYWELLSRWSRAFGKENILCRKFERTSFASGDLIADFLTAIGCDPGPTWQNPGSVNSSLDARCLEFLRLMNLYGGVTRPPKLIRMLESVSDGPLIDIPEHRRVAFMRELRDSNAMVAREYFGAELTDSDDPLFLPRSDRRERTHPRELGVEEIIALAATLLSINAPLGRRRNKTTPTDD